ncbi:MAG: B12-binding domain-containing radical SAM protein [Nitrospirota bacterium]
MSAIQSVLYVWLPCKEIYPIGLTYLANFIHERHPEINQQILDLTPIPRERRKQVLADVIKQNKSELVCFSWRDIQVFAPHEGDASLKYAFNFYHSINPFKKAFASYKGLEFLWRYYQGIREFLGYPWLVAEEFPDTRVMIGGGAFSVFADQLIHKLPEGTIGILGEGEEAVLKVIEGKPLDSERYMVRERGVLHSGRKGPYLPLNDFTVDVRYLSKIYPQHTLHRGNYIGVQTKRGCPYDCQFCEYPYIEGKEVRHRPPDLVLRDMVQHYKLWGTRKFWFTDAQFITGREAYLQVIEILERVKKEDLRIEWSGYVRTSHITAELAKLMVETGVGDLEVAITSGSQAIINNLHMGFSLEKLYEGCRHLKDAGFAGKLILNYSPNTPGETEETLLESVQSYKRIAAILGEDHVFPMLFFLGVQPHTGFEQTLLTNGYLHQGYNPLSLNPLTIKKLLYNPPPFSKLIAKACLKAWAAKERELKATQEVAHDLTGHYADTNLFAGVVKDSGRQVLINIERELVGPTGR